MVTTFGNVDNALKNLNDSSKNQQSALQSVAADDQHVDDGRDRAGQQPQWSTPTLPPGGITP
jgi:hypothetical protein